MIYFIVQRNVASLEDEYFKIGGMPPDELRGILGDKVWLPVGGFDAEGNPIGEYVEVNIERRRNEELRHSVFTRV